MLEHSGGIMGFNAVVAYLAEDDAYVAAAVNDKDVPAAAGLLKLVQTIRSHRDARTATWPLKQNAGRSAHPAHD